jgi:hypothetical protein
MLKLNSLFDVLVKLCKRLVGYGSGYCTLEVEGGGEGVVILSLVV